MKFEIDGVQRLQFEGFFLKQVFVAVLDAHDELMVGIGDVFWVGLFFEQELNVHLWMQLLVRELNGDFLPSDFT